MTGASRGIGRAITLAFAKAGAGVALMARDPEQLAAVAGEVEEWEGKALVVPTDVTDRAAVAAGVAAAIDGLGHIDIVVNNAGGASFASPFTETRFSGWATVQRLNVDSVVHVCQEVGPHLLQRGTGSVINIASVAGASAAPNMAHYGAAKAAVLSLTRTLALEWAAAGVRVNALLPGWVATDLTAWARADESIGSALISRVPLQRWATPDEIAGPALFLASDAASFVTGHTLVVDGGLLAGGGG